MLASFCTRFWDVQSFIFCWGRCVLPPGAVRAGDRLTSRGRTCWGRASYLQGPYVLGTVLPPGAVLPQVTILDYMC